MKIAINSLGVNGGGGRTYLENLLPPLEAANSSFRYFVIVRPSSMATLPKCGPNVQYVPAPLASGIFNRFLLEQTWLPLWLQREKIDLLYSPADSTTLLAPCPVVLAMRNMNLYVKRDKGWALPFRVKFSALSALARVSSKIAKKIIFVSEYSRETISKQLAIQNEKQEVIYHGVSPIFFEIQEKNQDSPKFSYSEPYILSISSVYRYKNYVRLIEAFATYIKSASQDYHLVIAGKPFDEPYFEDMKQAVRSANLTSRVHLLGEVPYSDLPALYRRSTLFAFPSYLETFGHPLVEAMASGTPIIAADIPNSREITGGAALYFNPYDVDDLARTLTEVLEKKGVREELARKSKIRALHFSWKKCAKETASVFEKVLNA